jgi:MFS family permease
MASSTYAGIEREFGISQEVAILSVSLFVLGLGSGPLLLGPVSEFVGRRKVYLASYLVFLLFNIPVALANNIGESPGWASQSVLPVRSSKLNTPDRDNTAVHLIFRFITGFAGSAFLSISGGTVSDMFINSEVGPPMAFIAFCPFSGPVLGPLIAGFINQNTYWRWTYYLVLIWAGVELVLVWFFVPESYRPQVLRLKAKRRVFSPCQDRCGS